MDAISADTVAAVLAGFHQSLIERQFQDFQSTTVDDVCHTAIRIQNEHAETKSLMDMTRLAPFLEFMEEFQTVIGVFTDAPNILAFIWGPMNFLLLAAESWAESFDVVLYSYSELGRSIPRLSPYSLLW
ncbi:hypothetical protein BKA61DRAFT_583040 [Leptodontidium sp. MPI-SDFR-AT-0119]|nr:hypothetical protein BKA61DRAFT_583040 [Leptodontidium sp. MPI-SDFR-AT-0119]